MTTEISTSTDAGTLTYDMRIEARPEVVWRLWTEPDQLVRWMGKVARLAPEPGGIFRLDYGRGDVAVGSFLEVDPPRRLVFSWGWEQAGDPVGPGASRVEVELEPIDSGATRLRLRHSGLPDPSRTGHDEGWRQFLARLGEVAPTT